MAKIYDCKLGKVNFITTYYDNYLDFGELIYTDGLVRMIKNKEIKDTKYEKDKYIITYIDSYMIENASFIVRGNYITEKGKKCIENINVYSDNPDKITLKNIKAAIYNINEILEDFSTKKTLKGRNKNALFTEYSRSDKVKLLIKK